MTLSKSQYIRGLQCHKSLWLYKNRPELRETTDQTESLFNEGINVGELAKSLFPDGVEVSFDPQDFQRMVSRTQALIENGTEVIYEAAFNANGIFVMVDILVREGDTWKMYEVKASTEVKEYHLNDLALQWFVVSQVVPLSKASIIHIDNTYERHGALNIDALFSISDVTERVFEMQDEIEPNLITMQEALNGGEPVIDIGGHCSDPFECDFGSHCWQHVPTPSVFSLYRMNWRKKFEMYYKGMIQYEDIPDEYPLNETQRLQLKTARTGKPHIDTTIIHDFLETITFPINFFDFETFNEAIPRFDKQRPYMQMPFQYSLHILHEDGTLEHGEFLGDEETDPRMALIDQMLQDITETGSIVAYNQSFEIGRIKELAHFDPSRANQLLALNARFVDLIVPFRRKGYYHPDFNGSFSIKSVLPALFPNDPELDYKKLGTVQNGGDAMDTFANLHLLKDETKREEIRNDLLSYCHLDTLAMVRIWEKLHEVVRA